MTFPNDTTLADKIETWTMYLCFTIFAVLLIYVTYEEAHYDNSCLAEYAKPACLMLEDVIDKYFIGRNEIVNATYLISGQIDFTCLIWDLKYTIEFEERIKEACARW